MESRELLQLFEETNALLHGHFLLTSGAHSDTYFQCALLLQHPQHCEAVCRTLLAKLGNPQVDVVIAPAIGGIPVSTEIGRLLGARAIFAEREGTKMSLRRGFTVTPGERVLCVEDVTTTGGSVQEIIDIVKEAGGTVVAVGSIVDRSGGSIHFGHPFAAALELTVPKYDPADCPLCRQGLPAVKPGSRKIPGA